MNTPQPKHAIGQFYRCNGCARPCVMCVFFMFEGYTKMNKCPLDLPHVYWEPIGAAQGYTVDELQSYVTALML